MTAIITDALKRLMLDNIFNDVADAASSYYIGIGRSQDWDSTDTPPNPSNTIRDLRDFRVSMQAIKTAEDVSYVIPRHNWSAGTRYSAYDDALVGYPTNSYYIITDEQVVYMCIQQGRNAAGASVTSTVKPTGTLTYPFTTADGYVWRYMYTIGALRATKFISANYMPVQYILSTDSNSSALEIEQKAVQDQAVPGEIINIRIISGGTGYATAPDVTFTGNGSKVAQATATISGGTVVKIEMNDSGSGKALGRGYDFASVIIDGGGGTGATARAVLSPAGGIGADARNDLRSTGLMFNAKITGTEQNQFVAGNDFRQIALIKNPKVAATDSDYTGIAGSTLRKLKFGSIVTEFSADKTIKGTGSAALAYVDKFDSSVIWYHQTEATGFTAFTEGEEIKEEDGNGQGILDDAGVDGDTFAYTIPEVNNLSGSILYLDNRAPIERSVEQTEDIKVIIQL